MKSNSFLFFISVIIIYSCANNKTDDCEFTYATGNQGPVFYIEQPYINTPIVNPSNHNEVIYRYGDNRNSNFNWDLIKLDLITLQKEIIYTGQITNDISWGINNKILFEGNTAQGNNVYMMNDDGSDLKIVNDSTRFFSPLWNKNASKFIMYNGLDHPNPCITFDHETLLPIDTFYLDSKILGLWSITDENIIVRNHFDGLLIGNLAEESITNIYELEYSTYGGRGATFISPSKVFWTHSSGIFITDIETYKTEKLMDTCPSLMYQRPTYSSSLNKIILEKIERHQPEENAIINQKVTIVTMDIDGKNESSLDL